MSYQKINTEENKEEEELLILHNNVGPSSLIVEDQHESNKKKKKKRITIVTLAVAVGAGVVMFNVAGGNVIAGAANNLRSVVQVVSGGNADVDVDADADAELVGKSNYNPFGNDKGCVPFMYGDHFNGYLFGDLACFAASDGGLFGPDSAIHLFAYICDKGVGYACCAGASKVQTKYKPIVTPEYLSNVPGLGVCKRLKPIGA